MLVGRMAIGTRREQTENGNCHSPIAHGLSADFVPVGDLAGVALSSFTHWSLAGASNCDYRLSSKKRRVREELGRVLL